MPETLKLPLRTLLRLHAGLSSLDGIRKSKTEIIPFEFSRSVKWNLTKNTVILEREKEVFDRLERQSMDKLMLVPGEQDAANIPKALAHNAEMEAHKDREMEVSGILFVTLDDLMTRPPGPDGKPRPDNEIPQSVLAQLSPIIKEPAS